MSYECVFSGLPVSACVVREMKTMSAAALWHQVRFPSTSRSKNSGQCSVSRRAYRKRHGLRVAGRGRPVRRLEEDEELLLRHRFARHGARRPSVQKQGVNRMIGVPDLAAFDHSFLLRRGMGGRNECISCG